MSFGSESICGSRYLAYYPSRPSHRWPGRNPGWSQPVVDRRRACSTIRPAIAFSRTARIIVTAGKVLENSDLMTRNGLIAQVGDDLQPAPGMLVIDCKGKSIYPGLIDAYSEWKIDTPAAANSDWNANVHPELRVADHYAFDKQRNEQYRQSGFVARLVAPTGGQVKGTSAIVCTADGGSGRQASFDPEVGLHLSLTLSGFGREAYPGSPMGALTLVRQTLYDVDWYDAATRAASANANLARPEVNQSLQTLKRLRDANVPLIIDAPNELYFLRGDAIAREFSWPTILRGSGREYRRLQDIVNTGWPVIVPLQFPKAPDVATPESARAATLERLMHWDIAPENPRMLAEAGITMAFTTHGLDKIGEALPAVRQAIRRGLSQEAALTALTTAPAKMFGIDHRLGTLESGKLASFVVTKGELFDKKAKCVETWVEGERFEIDKSDQDVRGTWRAEPTESATDTMEASISIKGSPKRLTGTATILGKKIKLGKVQWEAGRLSADIPTKKLDREGIARLTIFVDDETLEDQTFVGRWYWPDGSSAGLNATWTAAKKDDADKDEADDADGEEKIEPKNSEEAGDNPAQPNDDQDSVVDVQQSSEQPDQEKTANAVDSKQLETEGSESANKPDSFSQVQNDDKGEDHDKNKTQPNLNDDSGDDDDATASVDEKESDTDSIDDAKEQEAEKGETEDQSDEDESLTEPLYGVNYPLGAYGIEAAPEQPALIAFTHATVWTSGPAGVLENATVMVRAGKIAAVGIDVEVPADATTIDLTGKHLSPGIIDCHSHIATDGGLNESTQAVTAEVRISDFIDPNDISIYRQLAGGTTAANILHGSANPIGGQNQVIKLRWGANPEALKFKHAPAGIKFALGENVKQSNWGDSHRSRYPQTRMGVEELIVDALERARTYEQRNKEWMSRPSRFAAATGP